MIAESGGPLLSVDRIEKRFGTHAVLRCINLLEPLDAGRIVLDGRTITDAGVDANLVRREIGTVFQRSG